MNRVSVRVAVAALILAAAPSLATTTYRVTFNGNDQFRSTPISRSDSYPLGNSTTIFTGEGFAYPGHVGCFDRVDITWTNDLSAGAGGTILCDARSTDFVISGPAGPPVSGTLHFRLGANFSRVGGFPGSGAHGSTLYVEAIANDNWATGSYGVNNAGTTTANGIFAGLSGNVVDLPFSITANFPVGSPFYVDLHVEGGASTYGNNTVVNPGFVETSAGKASSHPVAGGLRLAEVGGVIMDLPAGYTINSPDWGVVNNHFQSTVDVYPTPPVTELAVALQPNPSVRDVDIELSLPRADDTRVELFDPGGRLVRTLVSGQLAAGSRRLHWDGRDGLGREVSEGIYFLRVAVGRETVIRKLVRLD